MVQVQRKLPTKAGGGIDSDAWLETVGEHISDTGRLRALIADIDQANLGFALELADLLCELKMDEPSLLAGVAYRDMRAGRELAIVDQEVGTLTRNVIALASTSLLEMSSSNLQDSEQESQVENIKRMLVAMTDDPRVAVVKLAERVVALRRAKNQSSERRARIAQEAETVFAPLAGRLGIAQLKWELEDLSLRYSQESVYMDIAKRLSGRRADRERQMHLLEDRLRSLLRSEGVEATVHSRAKHIFSIWRKMQHKQVSFEQVYDVRAMRVVVSSLTQCYAVLGIIHTTWPYIPSEFDDYIANPKENGYQSIHTAVTLEDGQVAEIQIRTQQMHDEAELGVCAHWSYKGDEDQAEAEAFRLKTEWLRQVIEWHEELSGTERLATLLAHRVSDERIYVSTPKGHVLDLPEGATVLDFAYRVHTDVGHGCRGGKVDGRPAKLYQQLSTAQKVEIDSENLGQPRREWLDKELGFVRTDRARAKLVSHFRSLDEDTQSELGQQYAEQALNVLGLSNQTLLPAFEDLGFDSAADCYRALGSGELDLFAWVEAVMMRSSAMQQLTIDGSDDAGRSSEGNHKAPLYVVASNRDGLLQEITEAVGSLKLAMSETSGRVIDGGAAALINLEVAADSFRDTLVLASRLREIEGVSQVGYWSREKG